MYDHKKIEKKWQDRWKDAKAGFVDETSPQDHAIYYLIMFPYPSGSGLHVGHVESYTAIDILARKERMCGKNVLCPIGYDAFGLPAENYAIKTGVHPKETTETAIANFHRQMESLGLSFDWSREISTADPTYYKWTQWIFLQFYNNGLAYRKKSPVNWCEGCHTVLANEQVVDGACERCGTIVTQKDLEQWFFNITKYADRLLSGLDKIDWPEKIKSMQRNWIGKSVGAEIKFACGEKTITVFTTRPDTLFGASYLVLAPEHELVDSIVTDDHREEVDTYRTATTKKSSLERTELQKEKTGVFTGAHAINPATNEQIPIWIADYVITTYGTGAIMAVPAHDERDFEFAKKYKLEIKMVVESTEECFTGESTSINSDFLNGLSTKDAKQKIISWLEEKGIGNAKTTFRLRDWLVSRQRYWGAPIPIIWCEDCGEQPVEESQLPVELPTDVDFKPTGESPLVDSKTFHDVKCPKCGKNARRESDTMDTFVDSSWYYLRYTDPHNPNTFADKTKIDYWCPVDLYLGGAEHAVLHLLYSRFFAYALHDLGHINFEEPFLKLKNQGLILGPDGNKMSKSKGNVVNPDEVLIGYGADAIRLYEMFMGPLEDNKPWDIKGVVGVRRFLDKVYFLSSRAKRSEVGGSLAQEISPLPLVGRNDTIKQIKLLHKSIKKITEDLKDLKFNTSISQLMILTNKLTSLESIDQNTFETFLKLLAPFAPHITEELWEQLGHSTSIFIESWPEFDSDIIVDELIQMGVQVNGKLRGTIILSPDDDETTAKELAMQNENVAKWIEGKEIKKIIYVKGKIFNIVV